ncbi:hypothetical protein Taro_051690 [Colocasia esculenta]|uniref:Ataxin-10 domain-containing protein n=1 Tax=Colocasia esculenta TaxID=4460 RepID=A0A843XHH0_COLES|nr:hypothetical protein [Colocasia esculenta]
MASPGLPCPAVDGGGDLQVEEDSLDSLLEASRTPEGRFHLAPHLSAVLRRLHPDLPLLLLIPTLRLVRNLYVGEPAGQAAFLVAGGTDAVASVVFCGGGAAAAACLVLLDVARVGLQLMGNVAAAGEKGQRGIWDRFFLEGLLELGRLRDVGACDTLCMVLRSCCCSAREGSVGRLEELCSIGRGLPILKEVLVTANSDDYCGDWLKLLLSWICIQELFFPLLFSMFSSFEFSDSQNDSDYRDTYFTIEQAFLLGLLTEILNGLIYRGTISKAHALPTGSPAFDVLGYSLTILRDLCASHDSPSSGSDRLVVESLVSSGLCHLLLALLRDLEPPSVIRRTLSQRANKESSSASPSSSKVFPYRGFRRDVVAVIGNCTCGRKQVQDEIRQQNGILLLLQQFVVDEDNPYSWDSSTTLFQFEHYIVIVGALRSAMVWQDDYCGDWLKLLLSRICIEELFLPLLFSMFSSCEFFDSQNDADYRDTRFTTEQAFLLGLLSEILSGLFYRGTISSDFTLAIFQVLKEAASVVDFTSRGSSPLPTGSPAIDVLGYSLTILRDLCASDDSPSSGSDRLVESLVSSGLCRLLLALLRDLEPPSVIRRTLSQGANMESSSASPSSSKVCPYRGFRRDVVAVIGNCTCGMKQVQDEIRQQNGILLLLQQCVVDEDNPYLREWGMLTVSYLLEGNVENQQQVAELELQEPIDTPEITSLGLKVDIDKKTGRVRLVNV